MPKRSSNKRLKRKRMGSSSRRPKKEIAILMKKI